LLHAAGSDPPFDIRLHAGDIEPAVAVEAGKDHVAIDLRILDRGVLDQN
jgi:hypothetical protein